MLWLLQKNHPSRADTHWTAPGSRRRTRRRGLCGSRWLCRSRRASESSSRVETSAAAKERPSWLKSKAETAYAHVFLPHTPPRSSSSAFIRSSHASSKCPPQLPLMSLTDSKGCGSTGPSSKPQTPDEPKRPDSLLGRFERREQMKKAATLPSSVTGTHPHVQAAELRAFCNILQFSQNMEDRKNRWEKT